MALATDLAKRDAAYRALFVRRQAGVSLAVSRLFSRLSIEDIITGSPELEAWLDKSVQISMAMRERVGSETFAYLEDIRRLAAPSAPPLRRTVTEPPSLEQIRTSLFVTGVVSARKRIATGGEQAPSLLDQSFRKLAADPNTPVPQRERALEVIQRGTVRTIQDEIDQSGQMAGAAAARHTGDASRDQTIATVQSDKRSIGWVRITSGKPCYFCAALASRGPVYQDDSFDESDARFEGPGQHKVHDNCSCALRQVYSRSTDEWPALNQEMETRWKDLSVRTNREYGRNPTMLDWRREFGARLAA